MRCGPRRRRETLTEIINGRGGTPRGFSLTLALPAAPTLPFSAGAAVAPSINSGGKFVRHRWPTMGNGMKRTRSSGWFFKVDPLAAGPAPPGRPSVVLSLRFSGGHIAITQPRLGSGIGPVSNASHGTARHGMAQRGSSQTGNRHSGYRQTGNRKAEATRRPNLAAVASTGREGGRANGLLGDENIRGEKTFSLAVGNCPRLAVRGRDRAYAPQAAHRSCG